MAGAEQAGVASARPALFEGATYCVTPEPDAPTWAIERVEALASAVGGRLVRMAPEVHDHVVAGASHLPLLASAALMHATTREPGWEEALGLMAATGYRDATRLASGDATMHRDICVTNAEEIRPLLLDLADTLREAAERLDDPDAIEAWLRSAQERRAEWLARSARQRAASEVARPDAASGA
jgi:prephenate dehydrogenase